MKLARLYTGKHEYISLHASTFTDAAGAPIGITGNQGTAKNAESPYAPGVAFAPAPLRLPFAMAQRRPEECGHQCAKAIDDVIRFATPHGDVAAFHRRTSHGRRRHHLSAAKLFQRGKESPRPARHPLYCR